ncbi:hypothetical protein LTR56_014490 [Elasticomyces elasticus]|nr:hypothetical protein LTR56_014490 [Elasticomyces elasticus]KAK3667689.1 hypothetical protein LTR22_001504 [Elasticomyces elasticus]KAK4920817.1 hypothetical protein LTR49_011720 [Elasticomyces elasticus]KAK5767158.1 hypothetical protein LTS12_002616 [Elasticomyces elasticus]
MAALQGSSSRDIFDFMGLAQELRDLIYGELRSDVPMVKEDGTGIRLIASRLPRTNILLISRQISSEYRAIAEKEMRLSVQDHLAEACKEIDYTIPTKLLSATELHMYVFVACKQRTHPSDCDLVKEMQFHKERMIHVVGQLHQLRISYVHVRLIDDDHAEKDSLVAFMESCALVTAATPSRIAQLDVTASLWDDDMEPALWDYAEPGRLVVTWKQGQGLTWEDRVVEDKTDEEESDAESA